ncbi:integrase core domain-containing protein [Phthorimaea operculella]|nr:integrase core domain-containing protein [Phthorimaea operculella]
MQIWHIDFMSLERQWYLTIIDKFSKYAIVKPTEKSKVYDTLSEIFAMIGSPRKIVHDGEQSFCSEVVSELFQTYEIVNHTTSPQHHKSNSDVERLHSTLQELFRLQRDSDLDQNQKIHFITHAYNNTTHSSINKTPFEVHFGRKPRLRNFDDLRVAIQNYTLQQKQFVTQLNNDIHNLLRNQKQQRNERYNRAIHPREPFKVGDKVYLKNSKAERHKTNSRFLGPYRVEACEPNNKYKLNNGRTYHMEELFVTDSSVSSVTSSDS